MYRTMTYLSKIKKKALDVNELKLDLLKVEPIDFEERTNVLGDSLMKHYREALIEQQNKAYKELSSKLGHIPLEVTIEEHPMNFNMKSDGVVEVSQDIKVNFDVKKEKKEMQKKYKLLSDETKKTAHGNTVYRIEALKDFYNVKKGQKGGYIQGEWNLSHSGNCWVHDEAFVWQDAVVSGDATIRDRARVFGDAIVRGDTEVSGTANVFGHAVIDDCAVVSYGSTVKGNAVICEDAYIQDQSIIRGNAKVLGDTRVRGQSEIFGNAVIKGNSSIWNSLVLDFAVIDDATVHSSRVYDNAVISGAVEVVNAEITKDAVIKSEKDYLTLKNNWTSGRTFTYTHSNKTFVVGCFTGTGDELIEKAYEDGEKSGKFYENAVEYVKNVYKLHDELGGVKDKDDCSWFPNF